MKKLFAFSLFCLLLTSPLLALQTKQGVLTKNETWSGEIHVVDSVVVPKGITLTIKPGTIMKFKHNRNYKGGIKAGLSAAGGTINAVGKPDQQIWFTSDAPDPVNGDWMGIGLGNSISTFKYVIIEFAGAGIEQFAAKTLISHSIIRWNNIEGIFTDGSETTIEYNTFYGNAYHDIALENKNKNMVIKNNVFVRGQTPIIFIDSQGTMENNYFYNNYRLSGIGITNNSDVTLKNNYFQADYYGSYYDILLGSKGNIFGNKFSVKKPPFKFDYKDIKKHVLNYHPGDPEDKFPYIYASEDETRKVLKRIGKGLGFGWSFTYGNGYLWKLDEQLTKINPETGTFERFPVDQDTFMGIRGLAFDGQDFWTISMIKKKVIKFKFDGKNVSIVKVFDSPPDTAIDQITSDGKYIYIPDIPGQKGLHIFDKNLAAKGFLKMTPPAFGPITLANKHIFVTGGRGIEKYNLQGELIGSIYPPAREVMALAWDGKNLWVLQKTCELWNDDKIFKLGILNDSLNRPHELNSNQATEHTIKFKQIDEAPLYLDLYYPKQPKDQYPLVIWIHGGGWSHGSRVPPGLFDLTKQGFAVASIDYRLSHQAKFPAQINDVKDAVIWLRTRAKEYRLNPDKIGVWGHSAGGHLAALLGATGQGESKVQAVCEMSGPIDLTVVLGKTIQPGAPFHEYQVAATNLLPGHYPENLARAREANPATHVDQFDPPFLIFHGKKDDIVPFQQAQLLYDQLKAKGVSAEIFLPENAGHGFDPEMDIQGKSIKQRTIDFFEKHLDE